MQTLKRFPRPLAALLLAAVCGITLAAQGYAGTGRDPARFDPGLASLKPGARIAMLDDSGTGSFNAWCTSFLAPEGAKPAKTADMDEELNDYGLAVDRWSCMYSPERAQDGDTATAWCEGASDDGIGQAMVAKADLSRPVRIWTGFGKSADLFAKNNRPKRVLVTVLAAGQTGATQMGFVHMNILALAQAELELKDLNAWQPLPLPPFKAADAAERQGFVAVKILSVYPGSKYRDTLISEIGTP